MTFLSVQTLLSVNFAFVRGSFQQILSDQSKKILIVAIAIFGVLASAACLYRYYFARRVKVCFVASDQGPAAHFAVLSQVLDPAKYEVSIVAKDAALAKLRQMQIEALDLKQIVTADFHELTPGLITKICQRAQVVITDVGNSFAADLHTTLTEANPGIPLIHLSYYDNPVNNCPMMAINAILKSNGVLLANPKLAGELLYASEGVAVDLSTIPAVGIGYYPIEQAKNLRAKRAKQRQTMRAKFFNKMQLKEQGQSIFVYFGGNHADYFEKAWPRFLALVQEAAASEDLSPYIFVIQQHPDAKERNEEASSLKEIDFKVDSQLPQIVISPFNAEDAQVLADGVLYYQSNLGPQFALMHLPVMQIGHRTYSDLLVRNNLCPSVQDAPSLIRELKQMGSATAQTQKRIEQQVYRALGFQKDWAARFEAGLSQFLASDQDNFDAIIENKRTLYPASF